MSRFLKVAFLSVLLAGCSSSDEGGKTVVRFLEAPDAGGVWRDIIERFGAVNPDIDVELVEGPAATNTREDMYAASFLAGQSSYDIVYMDVAWLAKFASKGWLIPLDTRFPKEKTRDFLGGVLDGSFYKGTLYSLPMQGDAGILYYRKDLLKARGRKPPKNFDELLSLASDFHNPPELYGMVFQGKQYEGLTCNFLEILWGMGGDLVNSKNQVALDSEAGRSALTHLTQLVRKNKAVPSGVLTYQEEESRLLFQEGKALFMRNWPYAYSLMQKDDSPVKGKVGMMPMVHNKGHASAATLGGWGFGISSFSKHPDAAQRFIEFATSKENQQMRFTKTGLLPTRHSIYKDSQINKKYPYIKEIYSVLKAARPRLPHPQYARISDILQRNVSASLAGRKSPEEAIKSAAQDIGKVLQ